MPPSLPADRASVRPVLACARTIAMLVLPGLQLVAALITAPLSAAPVPHAADTIRVATPTGQVESDRARVQEAFDRARPGDTVLFASGTYMLGAGAHLTVPDVTVLGHPGGTVLRGCEPERFDFPESFTIDDVGDVALGCTGLYVLADRQTIRGLTFDHTWHGIHVGHLASAPGERPVEPGFGGHRIENNVFRHVPNGIRVVGPTDDVTVIRSNEVVNAYHAFQSNGAPIHVIENRITVTEPASVPASRHPESGVILSPGPAPSTCTGSSVVGNVVEGTVHGIQVIAGDIGSCTRHEIRDNVIRVRTITLPPGYPDHLRSFYFSETAEGSAVSGTGIRLHGEMWGPAGGVSPAAITDVVIENNRVLGGDGLGIQIMSASRNHIVGNHVSAIRRRSPFPGLTWGDEPSRWRDANGSGIWISQGSDGNLVERNTFADIEGTAIHVAGDSNEVRMTTPESAVRDEGQGNCIRNAEQRRNDEDASAGACAPSSLSTGALDVQPEDVGYLWLEELHSDSVLRWTDARTTRTSEHLASFAVHDSLVAEIRSAAAASRPRPVPRSGVPAPAIRTGPWMNRFRGGVWMRQPVARFERGDNEWERVLDLDSLSRAEDTRFDIASVECLAPAHERCLLLLSRGGGTRTFDLREYDAAAGTFVNDGFSLGAGHTAAFWRDANSIYITSRPTGGADHAVIWRRGQSLDDARVLFTADPRDAPNRGDQGVSIARKGDRLVLLHSRHQYDIEYLLVEGDEATVLPVPRDVREILIVDGQLVLQLRSAWTPVDAAFPSGSLIGIDLRAFLDGSRAFRPIMLSDRDLVVDVVWSTRTLLVVRALADMKVRLFEVSHRDGEWERRRIEVPENGRVEVRNASPESDAYYFTHEDFLRPRTAALRTESGEVLIGGVAGPAFPAAPYQVDRWRAVSADGTEVPYFVVRRKDMPFDGRSPVIIYGYGGNGASELPRYLALHGPTWLSRGGVYVLANIRGGNEYGPEWHAAVRREKRQRAFDDFQAVAGDLVARQVTSPKLIGTYGGSNGGILVGTSFVQRPDLYGAVWANNGVLELQRCSQLSGVPPVGERGDGQNPDDWAYMQNYSPFHNLAAGQSYPAVLLTANRADDIVHPCHSRKLTARLEELGYGDIFYYETEEGGHGKAYSDAEHAMIMGFFLHHLHPAYMRE